MKSGTFIIWCASAWVLGQALRCWIVAIRELVNEYHAQRLDVYLWLKDRKRKKTFAPMDDGL